MPTGTSGTSDTADMTVKLSVTYADGESFESAPVGIRETWGEGVQVEVLRQLLRGVADSRGPR